MKLVSEIAVDQKTTTRDRTFEGVPDPNRPPVPMVQPRPYLFPFCGNYVKSQEHTQNPDFGCSTCSPIRTYAPNLIDFGPLISQMSIFLSESNFI